MRDYLGAPSVYNRELRGYHYDEAESGGTYELPGLWFTGDELIALVSSHHLLSRIQPGLPDREFGLLQKRIEKPLDHQHLWRTKLSARIRILTGQARTLAPAIARSIGGALDAHFILSSSTRLG